MKNSSISDLIILDSELAIKWNDDKESYISLKLLRDNCPCAFCSGETDVLGNVYKGPKKHLKEISYKITNFQTIGHYALRIYWGDNHRDGLYSYEILRKLGELK